MPPVPPVPAPRPGNAFTATVELLSCKIWVKVPSDPRLEPVPWAPPPPIWIVRVALWV